MIPETNSAPSLLHRYPLALFIILACLLGGGTIVLVVQGVIPSGLALVASLSASLAGIIITALVDGKAGLKLMLQRLRIWRVGVGYWLFALLFILLAFLLGSLANPLFNGDTLAYGRLKPGIDLPVMFLAFFIIAGLGQELGWTGFLLPRLQRRFSALTSSMLRAIIVFVWHLPILLYARSELPALSDFPYPGWIAQKGTLVAVAAMIVLFLFPWAVFCNWMFNNTCGSLLLVAVLHGSEIFVAYCMLQTGVSPENLDNYWGYGALLLLTALFIVIRTVPENLSRNGARVVHQSPSSPPEMDAG